MAKKQKKKRNRKYRANYTTGGRIDMRTGGRVSLRHGGPHGLQKMDKPNEREDMSIQRQDEPMPNLPPVQGNQPVVAGQQEPVLSKMSDQPNPRDEMIFADNQ